MAASSTRTHKVTINTILTAVERAVFGAMSVCLLFRDTREYFGGCRLFELKLLGVRWRTDGRPTAVWMCPGGQHTPSEDLCCSSAFWSQPTACATVLPNINHLFHHIAQCTRGADKSLARVGRKQARKYVRDVRDFNNIETRAVIRFFFSCKPRRRRKFTPFWKEH